MCHSFGAVGCSVTDPLPEPDRSQTRVAKSDTSSGQVGATVVVVTWNNDWYSGAIAIAIAIVTATGVFALRVAAMSFDWRAPRPVSRRR